VGDCTRRGIALEAALEAALALEAAQAGKCIKWGIINKEFRLYRGMPKNLHCGMTRNVVCLHA
jgi:hypothetical protein